MTPHSTAPAPWQLSGEAVAFLTSTFSVRLLVSYAESPVGSYDEHALAKFTWRGPHVWQMSVNSPDSRDGGRAIWGFPKTLEKLKWRRMGNRVRFERENQRFDLRIWGPSLPIRLSLWTAQRKDGAWVRVPFRVEGRLQLARRGRQWGVFLGAMKLRVEAPLETAS